MKPEFEIGQKVTIYDSKFPACKGSGIIVNYNQEHDLITADTGKSLIQVSGIQCMIQVNKQRQVIWVQKLRGKFLVSEVEKPNWIRFEECEE